MIQILKDTMTKVRVSVEVLMVTFGAFVVASGLNWI